MSHVREKLPCGHPKLTDGPCPICRHHAIVAASRPPDPESFPAREPGLLRKAASFAGAVVRHVAAGLPTVSPEVHAARLDACRPCDLNVGTHAEPKCSKCGCGKAVTVMGVPLVGLAAKAWMAQEKCPHPGGDRWAAAVAQRGGPVGA